MVKDRLSFPYHVEKGVTPPLRLEVEAQFQLAQAIQRTAGSRPYLAEVCGFQQAAVGEILTEYSVNVG